MEDINIVLSENSIELHLPTKNKGKFRWKIRENNAQFGRGFATREIPFNDMAYLE